MKRKAAFELSASFLVILVIAIVVFGFSVYIVKKFFTHAETIKMTYDERTEKEIERLLDDGSRIAIPFDRKTINNGEFKTFGIGILNTVSPNFQDEFSINLKFNKAYTRNNVEICHSPSDTSICGNPDEWLKTTSGDGVDGSGVTITKTIKNNEQEKFLLGVDVKGAPSGTYIFDLMVCVQDRDGITEDPIKCPLEYPDPYDTIHKLYVKVP